MLKLKLQYFGHLMQRVNSLEKTLMLGNMRQEEKGATEDEMVGWHHQLSGCEFGQTLGDSEGHAAVHEVAKSQTRPSNSTTKQINTLSNQIDAYVVRPILSFGRSVTSGWFIYYRLSGSHGHVPTAISWSLIKLVPLFKAYTCKMLCQ